MLDFCSFFLYFWYDHFGNWNRVKPILNNKNKYLRQQVNIFITQVIDIKFFWLSHVEIYSRSEVSDRRLTNVTTNICLIVYSFCQTPSDRMFRYMICFKLIEMSLWLLSNNNLFQLFRSTVITIFSF